MNIIKRKKKIFLSIVVLLTVITLGCSKNNHQLFPILNIWDENYSLLEDKVVWKERHAAFTSIIKFRGKYLLAFRVGNSHRSNNESENGFIRVLESKDLESWKSVDSLTYQGDLRDPFLKITPNGDLLMTCGVNGIIDNKVQHIETVYSKYNTFTSKFEKPIPINMDDDSRVWLWKYVWYLNKAYGFAYLEGLTPLLMESKDGINWKKLSELTVPVNKVPSEVDLVINDEGELTAFVRNDKGKGLFATAKYPKFNNWKIEEIEKQIGGPNMIMNSQGQKFLTYRNIEKNKVSFNFSIRDEKNKTLNDRVLTLIEGNNYDIGYGSSILINNEENLILSYYSYSTKNIDETGIHIAKISN